MSDNTAPKINPKTWPLATLAAVFFTLFAGVTHIVDQDTLSFDEYTNQLIVLWSALAVARGLAVKDHSTERLHPVDRFLNTFPWTWAILVFVAIIGYIGTLGDSLTFDDLGTKLAILGGAFGLGRGIAVAKRDVTTDFRGVQDEIDRHAVDQTDAFIDNPENAAEGHDYELDVLKSTVTPFEDPEETPEEQVAAGNLKLAIANGEISDPTAEDPEEDDEEGSIDNVEALEDVDNADPSSNGITQAWQDETVEGTEHAPSTRHTPDPDTLP